jgi:L-lactate dehydrogenase
MDIAQGAPFYSGTRVYSGTYADAVDSDMVIITSGMGRKPGQTRLDLAQVNVNILSDIAPQITKYAPDAIYLIVSNPVDVLTYVFHKITNIPANRIIGSGTILDTSRVRSYLAKHFDISQQNIHTHVLGEHGDSSFIPWSIANISNVPVDDYAESVRDTTANQHRDFTREEVEEYVRKSGGVVIARKGATYYAVSMSVCHLCKCLLSGIDTTLTVSTMVHGEYHLHDVCLSLLNVVGKNGAHGKIMLPLTEEEQAKLHQSAESLKKVIRSINL